MSSAAEAVEAAIIVPCLDEEETLPTFFERLLPVLDATFSSWQLIFVDDGSTDGTYPLLRRAHERDDRITVLRLTRNFGSHVAIAAGLDHAEANLAIVMAADLQDPPDAIPLFVERWREGYEIVWGARRARRDPFVRRAVARLFYGVVRRIALPRIPATGSGSFVLIDRAVIEAFRLFEERNRLTFGIISWAGFATTEVSYDRAARHAGRSKWSMAALVKTAIDTFVSFSYAPLRFISYAGLTVSLVAFGFGIYVIIDYVVGGTALRGWPSLMAAILFLGGAQLAALGVVAEYIWRISEESKRRPLYLVRDRIGLETPEHAQR